MSVHNPYFPYGHTHNSYLIDEAINALRYTRQRVKQLQRDGTAFERVSQTAADGSFKGMLAVDKLAEVFCRSYLNRHIGTANISVLGEECLWPESFKHLDLSKQHIEWIGPKGREKASIREGPEKRVTAILDMIDGSDLIDRGLGNWCSAMVVFLPGPPPLGPRILFSLVQNADDAIYGADEYGSFMILPFGRNRREMPRRLRKPEAVRLGGGESLRVRAGRKEIVREKDEQIAICFYAQKSAHLTTVPAGLIHWLEVCRPKLRNRVRLYNLAGNPMLVRLSNGEKLHAVFEHRGQYAHDAAPGLYIALKSHCHVRNLKTGRELAIRDLATGLLTPSRAQFRYVVASTKELAGLLSRMLRKRVRDTHSYFRCAKCRHKTVAKRTPAPFHCGQLMLAVERRLHPAADDGQRGRQ